MDPRPVLLVLRALNLGDLLVTVPALRALRRAWPRHRLVLAVPPVLAPLAQLSGAVDLVLPTADAESLSWAGHPPDIAVNLHGRGPQSHRALEASLPRRRIGLRAPGWNGLAWDDIARAHPHERDRWCAMLETHGVATDPKDLLLRAPAGTSVPARPPVLVHPGAGYAAKRWPVERFAELAAALERAGQRVLVTGSAAERPLAQAVADRAGLGPSRVLAGATSVLQLCGLVAGAALVVSGDTGIAHLASAYRTPSVVLFGPLPPQQWGPPVEGPHLALTRAEVRRGEPFADTPDPALLGVTVAEALRAAHTLLAAGAVLGA